MPPFSLPASLPLLPLVAAGLLVLCGVNADHFPPWTSFHSEAPAFLASALLLLALALQPQGARWTPALWLLSALAGSAWLQLAAGHLEYAGDAWVATAYLAAFGVAWMWGAATVRAGDPARPLLVFGTGLILLGLVTALPVLAQWLDVGDQFRGWIFQPEVRRSSGNLGQPNVTATVLLMASGAVAAFLLHGILARRAAWALFAFFAWAVVLTQSRTAMLSAVLMAALVLAAGWRSPAVARYRFDALAWLLMLFVFGWILAALPTEAPPLRADDGSGIGRRFLIWRQLLEALGDSPWSGFAWLQVAAAQQAGAALGVHGIEQVNYAHSVVLDLLVVLGVPLGLLVLGLVAAWLLRRLRRLQGAPTVAGMGLFVLVPLAVHMQLELPHAYAYLLLPAGVLLGAFEALTEPAPGAGVAVRRWVLATASAAWLAVLLALAYEYSLAEEDFRVNRFENRRLGRTQDTYHVPDLRMLTQLGEVLQAMRLRAQPGMSPQDVDVLVRASRRYSWAALHYRTALALALNGRTEDAGRQLALIQALFAPQIWEEGRETWLQMTREQYPQLSAVPLPPPARAPRLPAAP